MTKNSLSRSDFKANTDFDIIIKLAKTIDKIQPLDGGLTASQIRSGFRQHHNLPKCEASCYIRLLMAKGILLLSNGSHKYYLGSMARQQLRVAEKNEPAAKTAVNVPHVDCRRGAHA